MSSIWLTFLLTILLLAEATTLALAGFDEGKTAFDGKAYSEAQEEWRPLAEKGHTKAQYWMGVLYYSGYGVEKDYGQAASWWQKAAEKEHRNAQYWLGVLQFRGRGVPQSYEIAAQWWKRAVQPRGAQHESFAPAFQQVFGQLFSENASAQAGHWLAHLYASGKGIPQDFVKAHILYNLLIVLPGPSEKVRDRAREALNQVSSEMDGESLARAEDVLGLFTGLFALTKNDIEQAIHVLSPLAERAKVFGDLFEVFPVAIEEFTKTMPRSVTELGISIHATTILPFVVAVSLDKAENYPEANKWWQELAKMGDGFAMTQIGSRYLNGVGIESNLDDAIHWFRRGAEQGNASAQYLLGSLYFRGEGVAEDKVQAANWYREAAKQGSALAQNELGAMYENGIGVPKEDIEAVKWYRMAAEQGLVEARERLSQREEERLIQREEKEREGRRIPVARSDPSTLSGRVLLAISGWLDGLVGAGSSTLHLKLAAPMSSEEQNGAVTVRAPGAELFFLGSEDGYLDLGDLESKVRALSDVEFGFEFSLPSQLRVGNATANDESYISIDQSAFSGVWRSDLETTTFLDIDVRNVAVFDRVSGADRQIGTLESVRANQELRQTDGDLWDGQLAFNLQNLHVDVDGKGGMSIGDISVESELHAVDVWAVARLSEVVEDVSHSQDVGSVDLARVLEEFQAIEWGSSTARLTMGDVVGRENGVVNISLGGVLWEIRLSQRGDFMDLGMVIGAHDFVGKDALEQTIPTDVVPNAVRIDFAIADFPFLSSISTVLELTGKHTDDGPSVAASDVMGMLLGKMVEAGSQIKIESLNVAAPLYTIAASAEFSVDPASSLGFVGGATATITGLDEVTKLVVEQAKTNPGASSVMPLLILAQGIGKPAMIEGSEGTTFIYELQVPSDGVISVNETPFNVLLGGGGE